MGEKFSKLWKDPVWSKIISNLLWALILAGSAFAYVVYQKINLSISINESWEKFLKFLDTDKIIKNRDVLYAIILGLILLVNRLVILKVILFILRLPFGRDYVTNQKYNFTNEGKRSTSHFSNERCSHFIRIKPINETYEWSLTIYFNPNYLLLEKEPYKCNEKIVISKLYNENLLRIESFDKTGKKIETESKILLQEYVNQEFKLNFNLLSIDGGISVKILRLEEEIFKSSIKYGCNYFRLFSGDNNHDFNLAIDHTIFE